MDPAHLLHFLVIGAGAAGLMTARELARAGQRVTILEARHRYGGRIWPLAAEEFGYPAEGGAEFVDGAAPVTFLLSNAKVPTWWTQHPAQHPVLTGWFAGPKADSVSSLTEAAFIEMGLVSLAEIFDLAPDRIGAELISARAISSSR